MGKLHISRPVPDALSSVLGFHHLIVGCWQLQIEVKRGGSANFVSIILYFWQIHAIWRKLNKANHSDLTESEVIKEPTLQKSAARTTLRSVSIKTLDRVVGDQGKAQRFKGTEEHCRQDSQTASADFFSFCTKKRPFSFVMKPRVREVFDLTFHLSLEPGWLRTRGRGVSDA